MQHQTFMLHKQLYELDKDWKEVEKQYRDNRFNRGNPPRTANIVRALGTAIGITGWWLLIFFLTDTDRIVLNLSILFLLFRMLVLIPGFSRAREFEEKESAYLRERDKLVVQLEA